MNTTWKQLETLNLKLKYIEIMFWLNYASI